MCRSNRVSRLCASDYKRRREPIRPMGPVHSTGLRASSSADRGHRRGIQCGAGLAQFILKTLRASADRRPFRARSQDHCVSAFVAKTKKTEPRVEVHTADRESVAGGWFPSIADRFFHLEDLFGRRARLKFSREFKLGFFFLKIPPLKCR